MSQAKFHFAHEFLILATTLLFLHLMEEKNKVVERVKQLTGIGETGKAKAKEVQFRVLIISILEGDGERQLAG